MIVEPLPQAPAKVSRRELAAPEHSHAASCQPPKSLQPLCTVFSWTHSRIALPFLQTARFHTRTRRLMGLRRAFSNRIPARSGAVSGQTATRPDDRQIKRFRSPEYFRVADKPGGIAWWFRSNTKCDHSTRRPLSVSGVLCSRTHGHRTEARSRTDTRMIRVFAPLYRWLNR